MADNTQLNTMSGGDTYASDDIGGVKFPRVKLIYGADGVNSGDVDAANALPVRFTGMAASISYSGAPVSPANPLPVVATGLFVSVGMSGAALAPSNPMPARLYGSGAVLDHTNPLAVSVPSGLNVFAPSGVALQTPSGLWFQGGTGAALSSSNPLHVRFPTGAFLGLTASGLPVTDTNPFPVSIPATSPLATTQATGSPFNVFARQATGLAFAVSPASGAPFNVVAQQATGAPFQVTPPTGFPWSVTSQQATGTVHNVAQGTGAQWLATTRQATGTSVIVDQATGTSWKISANSVEQHGANPTGGPFLQGFDGRGATFIAQPSGSVVRGLGDKSGKQIVMPGAQLSLRSQGMAGLLGTGSRNIISAAGSGVAHAITSLQVVNSSPTFASEVIIHDGVATLWAGFAAPAGGGFAPNGGMFPLFTTSPNAALQAVCLATGAQINVCAAGFKEINF